MFSRQSRGPNIVQYGNQAELIQAGQSAGSMERDMTERLEIEGRQGHHQREQLVAPQGGKLNRFKPQAILYLQSGAKASLRQGTCRKANGPHQNTP
jgi:hypothetical protein